MTKKRHFLVTRCLGGRTRFDFHSYQISFMLIRFLISLPIRHELGIQVSTFVTFTYNNLNLVTKIVILNF